MPKGYTNNFQSQDEAQLSYDIALWQLLLFAVCIYYTVRYLMTVKPIPNLLTLPKDNNLLDLKATVDNLIKRSNDMNADTNVALQEFQAEISTANKYDLHSALNHFNSKYPHLTKLLLCHLRIHELEANPVAELHFIERKELIINIKLALSEQLKKQVPDEKRLVTLGWALQYLHKLDDFCLHWADAHKKVNFTGLNTFNAIIMNLAIQACYSKFSAAVQNNDLSEQSLYFQLNMFSDHINVLQNDMKRQRNNLSDSKYRSFVRHLDTILAKPAIPLYSDDLAAVEPVLLARNPHLQPKLPEAGEKLRFWVSYGVTVEASSIYHTMLILSHQLNDKSDIFIEQCVGYYSGTWQIMGMHVLKPIAYKDGVLKPEKVSYLELQQLYKHWEVTRQEYDIVDKHIKDNLFKKGYFNSFTKNCKHFGLGALNKIGIFSPELEGQFMQFLPGSAGGLLRGSMRECAHIKPGENKEALSSVKGRDKWDCAPMIWGIDTIAQVRAAELSPQMLQEKAASLKKLKVN